LIHKAARRCEPSRMNKIEPIATAAADDDELKRLVWGRNTA
jgi:hypothetical protein